MFPILIPLKDGHYIPYRTLECLVAQTVKPSIIAISRERMFEDDDEKYSGYYSQARCRNLLVTMLKESEYKGEAVCMMDRTSTLVYNKALEVAKKYLLDREFLASVHFDYKNGDSANHFDLGICVVRTNVLRSITFRSDTNHTCNCKAFGEDVRAMGMQCAYLPGSFQMSTESGSL